MEKITINLPYIQEEVFIGENILEEIKKNISNEDYDKFLVVIDNQAYKKHTGYFESLFKHLDIHKSHLVFLKPKPQYKDLKRAQVIIRQLVKIGASRKTCIIAIGGGYVGDLAGFVSSIYMRGIDFIQIPTTLMSQCDGIIGKVAVNFKNIKNLTGTFYSPKMIFCDIDFIKSFHKTEQLYGLAEIWKYAILVNNSGIISDINMYLEGKKSLDYRSLINFSLLTKKYFVENDPFDRNGHHKALSLGHTLANVLEADPSFRHGLAVFYDIVFESIIANTVLKINYIKYNEIIYTASLFEIYFKKLNKIKKILCNKHTLNTLKFDKINSHGTYSFVIPTNDGYFIYRDIPTEIINKAIEKFLSLSNTFTKQ
jgi:3-dehydroquinate synthase